MDIINDNHRAICVIQPSFLPWRGFFHLVQKSDIFVHYDDVRYSKHSWRNRNRIISSAGTIWMTVPVEAKGCLQKNVDEIKIANNLGWRQRILGQIITNYRKSPFFENYYPAIERILKSDWEYIADLDIALFDFICECLSLKRKTYRSRDLMITETDPVKNLIELCRHFGGTKYISGPSAQDYIKDSALFKERGIELEFFNYPEYPPYKQLYGSYDPQVSIIDLLFNVGGNAIEYIWGTNPTQKIDRRQEVTA